MFGFMQSDDTTSREQIYGYELLSECFFVRSFLKRQHTEHIPPILYIYDINNRMMLSRVLDQTDLQESFARRRPRNFAYWNGIRIHLSLSRSLQEKRSLHMDGKEHFLPVEGKVDGQNPKRHTMRSFVLEKNHDARCVHSPRLMQWLTLQFKNVRKKLRNRMQLRMLTTLNVFNV